MKKAIPLMLAASALFPGVSQAGNLSVHGYGTVAISHYHSNDGRGYGRNGGLKENWSANEDTKAGIQVQYNVSPKLRLAAQGRVAAINNQYRFNLAWAYAAYDLTPNTTIRAGRLRLPMFNLSDSADIGYSYPWVRVPEQMYSQITFDSYTGADVIQQFNVASQPVTFEAFAGHVSRQHFSFLGNDAWVRGHYVWGGTASTSFGNLTLRAAYGAAYFDYGYDAPAVMIPPNPYMPNGMIIPPSSPVRKDIKGNFIEFGFNYDSDSWMVRGEYGQRGSKNGAYMPDTTAWDMTAGYHVTDTLMPFISYSRITNDTSAGQAFMSSVGARYDVTSNMDIKAQFSHVKAQDYTGLFSINSPASYTREALNSTSLGDKANIATVAVDFVF